MNNQIWTNRDLIKVALGALIVGLLIGITVGYEIAFEPVQPVFKPLIG
jgi:hypothetical protein